MKTYFFLAYVLLVSSFVSWLFDIPAEKFHGIIYYPTMKLSGIFILFALLIKLIETKAKNK